jgi:hypothetical protein
VKPTPKPKPKPKPKQGVSGSRPTAVLTPHQPTTKIPMQAATGKLTSKANKLVPPVSKCLLFLIPITKKP